MQYVAETIISPETKSCPSSRIKISTADLLLCCFWPPHIATALIYAPALPCQCCMSPILNQACINFIMEHSVATATHLLRLEQYQENLPTNLASVSMCFLLPHASLVS